MSEEIKEIAESLREISTPTGLSYSGDRTLNNSYTEKIIDYITSLQQKVEQLEKENKKLKYDCSCSFHDAEELNQKLTEIIDERNELDTKLIQLENIRKEAIEECKSVIGNPEHTIVSKNELMKIMLNILNKGDNKE